MGSALFTEHSAAVSWAPALSVRVRRLAPAGAAASHSSDAAPADLLNPRASSNHILISLRELYLIYDIKLLPVT